MGLGLDALEDITAEKGIRLVRHIGGAKGFWLPQYNAISLRRDLNELHARCTLAHELGHATRGHTLCDGNTQQETQADRYAARLLISDSEYATAETLYGPHPGAIARELEVTVHLVDVWRAMKLSKVRVR
ncbi:ImmA/IrrE family metallo-endopeptidase [Corynebacterium sp. TAE3-ERU2]|uniref:ImmA/IrrE family metallo-endopeptidase n=1 Tax=Corynebacterium sp. TAE3-ERU2 TaxID=2849497 RepID=UPI001C47F9CE|nr:ImmA/IrrE family metallo-endopeptidase [Corynebacterium sp. TAE3-ERU2]MBV7302914.1 ImmA/IrrE family metallo-endopeptidase [Corynebacterium sp. TAE3-ERU2]